MPDEWTHKIARRKVLSDQKLITYRSFNDSDALRNELITGAKQYLGEDFDVKAHFTPSYRPWRQRLAYVPDGDLFRAIKSGDASVVTDQIDSFTEKGIMEDDLREHDNKAFQSTWPGNLDKGHQMHALIFRFIQ